MNDQYPPGTDVQNLVDLAMAEALGGEESSAGSSSSDSEKSSSSSTPDFGGPVGGVSGTRIELLGDVDLQVKIELGRTQMLVEDVLRLAEGSVVELDKLAGDPVDVYVNNRLVARGEVLVLNDNFCIRISEIVDQLDEKQIELAIEANDAD